MRLRALANGLTSAVNPNLLGTLMQSTGYAVSGDAVFTGSIAGNALTVSAINSGTLAVGSIIGGPNVSPATIVTALGTGSGGAGTYAIAPAQAVASEAMTATGSGARVPTYSTATGVPMQFQAVSNDDLEHVDALNISKVLRSVHLNGDILGLDRAGVRGGDLLLAPTRLSGAALDVWLVVSCVENWEASGWSHVIVALQQPTQSQ
jgi:hypothetical protein